MEILLGRRGGREIGGGTFFSKKVPPPNPLLKKTLVI
jgi:hypothetical protein